MKKQSVGKIVAHFGGIQVLSVLSSCSGENVKVWIRDDEIPRMHMSWLDLFSPREFFSQSDTDFELKQGMLIDKLADLRRAEKIIAAAAERVEQRLNLVATA